MAYYPYLLAILTETLDLTIHKTFIEVVLYMYGNGKI